VAPWTRAWTILAGEVAAGTITTQGKPAAAA
jgi:hypothetical protein